MFVALCVVAGGSVAGQKAKDLDYAHGESGRATKMIASGHFDKHAQENVLITSKSQQFDQAAANAAAIEVSAKLRGLKEVSTVGDPVTSAKGDALLVPITMRGDPDKASDHIQPLLDATAKVQKAHPQLRVEETGDASINKSVNNRVGDDLGKAEKLSLPITLIILLVAFGAIIAAGVPVLLALSAVAAAMGLSTLSSYVFPSEDTVGNVILLVGMAVGVDYSLFYLRREREERAKGASHVNAVEIAAATSGRSVVVSGFAVIVSAAGLYLADDVTFSSLASGMIIVVAMAVIGSLTVLPAILAKLGRWVDRPRVPFLWRLTARKGEPRLWPALMRPILRHPGATLLLAVAALVALALPATGMKLKQSGAEDLPQNIPAVAAYKHLGEHFPAQNLAHRVVVGAPADQSARVVAELRELTRRAAASPGFSADQPDEVNVSPDKKVAYVDVVTAYGYDSSGAKDSLRYLRSTLVPQTVGTVNNVHYAVGGEVAQAMDNVKQLKDALPWVMGFVLALTFGMMLLTFRSIVVALTAMLTNVLSALAAFGVLVLTFQHTWAEGLLDFHSGGAIITWIPLMLFVILFGLSMDYHVFVVSRIREAAQRGLPIKQAVAEGVSRSAGAVTSAAVVMVAVFSIFATLSLIEMKQLGVGLSVAIALDALLIRIVVLPSLMALLGRANWWPGRLSRKHPAGIELPEQRREAMLTH